MNPSVWLALVSPVVAVIVAVFGFRRSSKADRLKAYFEMQNRYLAPEVRLGRKFLHQHVAGRSPAEVAALDETTRSTIGFALAVMNSIAIACEAGYVDRDIVVKSMGRSYARAIEAARPFFDHQEATRGFRPYPYAERLAARVPRPPAVAPPVEAPAAASIDASQGHAA
ncbi:DUF4760 domain-containing protein [Actinoplanes sp. HUAS TT8]|uniref:DUF4760 domain-containing protein n=1 Tax=Actinoplanes sp. HUAS TT8 TaxID=3447453 RepID=UPI003F52451E